MHPNMHTFLRTDICMSFPKKERKKKKIPSKDICMSCSKKERKERTKTYWQAISFYKNLVC